MKYTEIKPKAAQHKVVLTIDEIAAALAAYLNANAGGRSHMASLNPTAIKHITVVEHGSQSSERVDLDGSTILEVSW